MNRKDVESLISIYGFSMFPVHGILPDNTCTCGKVDCTNQGKHPAVQHGRNDHTKNIEKYIEMVAGRKGLNAGIATGKPSNCFVIDVDGQEGENDLRVLEASHGTLPNTLTVLTGRGRHLYFQYPDAEVINRSRIIGDKVDVRGDGGYVLSPESNHVSGAVYKFVNPLESIEVAPDWLLDLVVKDRIEQRKTEENISNQVDVQPLKISEQPRSSLNIYNTQSEEERVLEALSYLSPSMGYDDWLYVGMALHKAGLPLSVWDNWSRGDATKYKAGECQFKWKGFNSGGGVSLGTLFKMAKDAGYRGNCKEYTKPYEFSQLQTVANRENPEMNHETGEVGEVNFNHKQENKEQKMFYIKGNDIEYTPDDTDFVQGLLTSGGISVVYGESNCGKTFFMTDLSFSVAENIQWRDKRVDGGAVLYVALEGIKGLKGRIEAYKRTFQRELNNLLVMPCPLDFLDAQGDITEFIKLIESAKADVGDIKLIVIDTLARAIGGGDENSGQDMGMLVRHADAIRDISGSHICFVHHSGKDKARGARGHSSLRAAVDTEIEISRTEGADYSTVKVVKQRDLEMIQGLDFKLERVELGKNRHGEMTSSCVVIPYNASNDMTNKKVKPSVKKAYDALVDCVGEHGRRIVNKEIPYGVQCINKDDFMQILDDRGLLPDDELSARRTYYRYRKELIDENLLICRKEFLWLPE